MSAYDEAAWLEDFDFLVRLGLTRAQIAQRMQVTDICLEGRIRRATRAGRMEPTDDPRHPAAIRATRSFLRWRMATTLIEVCAS